MTGTKVNSSGVLHACKFFGTSRGYQWRFEYTPSLPPYIEKPRYNKGIPLPDYVKKKLSMAMSGKPWTRARRESQIKIQKGE